MGTKEDILDAVRGTTAEAFVRQAMTANPLLSFEYTNGESRIDRKRTNPVVLINRLKSGDSLVGAAVHELKHLGSAYAKYVEDARRAVATGDFGAMVAAMVRNEARATAEAIIIADPNKYTSGYITVEQANSAMRAASSAGARGTQAYLNALTEQVGSFIGQNQEVMAKVEAISAGYFAQNGMGVLRDPPEVPPLERISIMPVSEAGSYVEDLAGLGDVVELSSGTYDQHGNWVEWDGSFVEWVLDDMVNEVWHDYGSAALGDDLSYDLAQQDDGDWQVSFSAVSDFAGSAILERIDSIGQPHGMADFLNWFQRRTEEMARDALIVSSVSPSPFSPEFAPSASTSAAHLLVQDCASFNMPAGSSVEVVKEYPFAQPFNQLVVE